MKEQIVASMAILCLLSAGSHADIIESFGSGADQRCQEPICFRFLTPFLPASGRTL